MLLRFIHTILIWTTSCTTSLFVYLKLFKELASVFVVGCVCKVKEDFRNHQIFQKVFLKNFQRRSGLSHFHPSLPFLRNAPAYTLSSEFHFFNAFPSRKRMQRYRLLRNRQAFLETFLKLSPELIHKYLITSRIKIKRFLQIQTGKTNIITILYTRARETHTKIKTYRHFHPNERTFY